ncbi:hypothetical protein [Flavobacterium suaedae]|uniref:hypothetical protein n=1 Tax=Flavobacterium suaedae TaxID=1767027 RepID=UPI001667B5FB|nr:hypothetical protein [Flavobacterium suaedae]
MANLTPAGGKNTKTCTHSKRVTRVTYASAGCEETAEYCRACGKKLTDYKIDCR